MDGYIDLYGAVINCAKEDYIRLHDHIHKIYNRIWPEIPIFQGGGKLHCLESDIIRRSEKNDVYKIRNGFDAIRFMNKDPYKIHEDINLTLLMNDWYDEAEAYAYESWLRRHK